MEEYMNIIETVNQTRAPYPKEKTLHQLFQAQVRENPNAEAAIFKGERITYLQLNKKSNQLARYLRQIGVGPDTIVTIMVKRSLEMIVGLYAILKAGGAYLPISPETPPKRISLLLLDSQSKVILTTPDFFNKLELKENESMKNLEIINLQNQGLYEGPSDDLPQLAGSESVAYVIYTSGSTGKPKGVLVQHRSLVNRLNWMQNQYPLSGNDIILQKTPYIFDVSLWELFWWSLVGASVCFMLPGFERFPQAIVETIEKNHVTVMHFVPSMMNAFLQYIDGSDDAPRMSSLKRVFVSGEALSPAHVQRFNQVLFETNGTRLTNLYGPTEATVDVSWFDCPHSGDIDTTPIGKPIDNTSFCIMNNSQILGIASEGELWVSGDCLARGYLNRIELTDDKFVKDPLTPQKRSYKTGDLAQWLPDGNIEFLGRIDFQVKIRGLRIELGEIEDCLLKHPTIKNCVVTVKKQSESMVLLIAYLEITEEYSQNEVKSYLRENLPDYMVPNHFVTLDALPVTPSGKIDRKSLPDPLINS
jgi:D-alanine--poly(phosphoribitol) ligase subunit 1